MSKNTDEKINIIIIIALNTYSNFEHSYLIYNKLLNKYTILKRVLY